MAIEELVIKSFNAVICNNALEEKVKIFLAFIFMSRMTVVIRC
jgi:hypothetical protein